jgi:adenylate cyclase
MLSGLVMFAFITIHLFNHALGVVSLALAESGLRVEMVLWRSPPITLLLYGAAAIHFSLALWTLYSRREWRLPWIEVLRLSSGFSFPLGRTQLLSLLRWTTAICGLAPARNTIPPAANIGVRVIVASSFY